MRLTPWVGSIAPGRYADLVLLDDVATLSIAEVWADGRQVSERERYIAQVPQIDWPDWATHTVNIKRAAGCRGLRHCGAGAATDHAGGAAASVPTGPTTSVTAELPVERRRRAARRHAQHHQVRDR